ncbi:MULTISPECIES: sensor domain-containing diguanylate cyclase [Rhodopseudomonas]|uniref:diguanylate cyclase n=1 Tax=Rhodopseudomonas palustris TaxID=1076 RepID=A0A0D7E007_RHOPL|nr:MULTISPECIES: sensor domain-containing diguanylate cyclase [Rhodopseudomonas]KIZ32992.1 diguanylate cyclase [Rhodopseudomonas palustris]MDF3811732.1 diguanylate cyclase [Rhodopseudomonas sp. BAL398]WOK17571.1 diguanylate cyclase [Rhodopseudomonas sp. BAL398]
MRAFWNQIATSLKTRVLVVTVFVFGLIAVPAYLAFEALTRNTVVALGTLFAEKQVLFDRYRGLEALIREVSLAETVARSPAVREWAQDESDPGKAARGLAELEQFRLSFHDKSYFFVVHASGNYYFNDAANAYQGNQLRYRVSRDNPRDGWYFKTIAAGEPCQLNVDRDDHLAVTKVWINCVLTEQGRVLGVIGTGVDLSEFIREVVALPQTGVTSMFVDRSGAIQAHRDQGMVDFHSLTKDTKTKKTIFQQVDKPADAAALAAMMKRVSAGSKAVESRFMTIGGHEFLVGVGYLDRLGWFNVTLMDLDAIIDRRLFTPVALLLIVMMTVAIGLVTILFRRVVLDRLASVESAARRVEDGDFDHIAVDPGRDEIGRLSRTLSGMARAVQDHTRGLEDLVNERTEKLRRLANIDLLTEIPNRRGFTQMFEQAMSASPLASKSPGLLLIDLDQFKDVNDRFGHLAGDRLLCETARRLERLLSGNDSCARWGGDEFVALVEDCDRDGLRRLCERMVAAMNAAPIRFDDGQDIALTVSIGACQAEAGGSIDTAIAEADAALYAAKRAGRNRFELFEPVAALDQVVKARA